MRQRASAGLIISEATGITREGLGWPNAPGLWNDAQVEGWKLVTDAVHCAGGRIVAQLWHMGRLVHPDLGGGQPVSSSTTTAPDFAHTYEGTSPMSKRGPRPTPISAGSSTIMPAPPAMRSLPVSTGSRSTAPMAIWSTSSCAIPPTCATMTMAARSTTGSLHPPGAGSGRRHDRHGPRRHPLLAQHTGAEYRGPAPVALFTELAKTLEALRVRGSSASCTSRPRRAPFRPPRSARPCDPTIRARSSSTATMTGRMPASGCRQHRRRGQHRPAVHRQSRPGEAHRARRAAQYGDRGLLFGWRRRLHRLSALTEQEAA